MKLPLIRTFAPARAPALRYGVALLSAVLALIPTFFLSDPAESRLVVFAVAVMVSAWYGGWKPGLAATSFALTVGAYYSLAGGHTPVEYRRAIAHLALFFAVALHYLLVQRRFAQHPGESAPLRRQLPLAGHERPLRHLPL